MLLFILACQRLYPDRSDHWHLPLVSALSSRWAFLWPLLISSTISLVSVWIISFHASPDPLWLSASSGYILLLQCLLYCTLAQVNTGRFGENTSTPILQKYFLRKVSVCSCALWTLLLAMSKGQSLQLQPTFFIISIIRAFQYFLLFTLVCFFKKHRSPSIIDSKVVPSVYTTHDSLCNNDANDRYGNLPESASWLIQRGCRWYAGRIIWPFTMCTVPSIIRNTPKTSFPYTTTTGICNGSST